MLQSVVSSITELDSVYLSLKKIFEELLSLKFVIAVDTKHKTYIITGVYQFMLKYASGNYWRLPIYVKVF